MLSIERCESCELAAWRSLFLSLPSDVAASTGARQIDIEGATVSAVSAVDVLAFNRALGVGADHVIGPDFPARIAEWYRVAQVPRFLVQVAPGPSSDEAIAILEAGGLRRHDNWLRLARDLGGDPVHVTSGSVPVRRAAGEDDAKRFARLVTSHAGWPATLDAIAVAAVGAPQWMHYVAEEDGAVVGAAAWFRDDDVAWLGGAATVAGPRRGDVERVLVERRLHDAREMGCRWAIAEIEEAPSLQKEASPPDVDRHGFAVLYQRPSFLGLTAP